MDKRKLSAVPRETATEDMLKIAGTLEGMRHIVTVSLIEDNKILLLYFYEIESLREGKTGAAFRTFLLSDDYITQNLKVSNVKWLTASFCMMNEFSLVKSHWNPKTSTWDKIELIFIRSDKEKQMIINFLKEYADRNNYSNPWSVINAFQDDVKAKRLAIKHKKETDAIDAEMNPIKEAPNEFFEWVWETGMSFSRYVIYKETKKGEAECECTHCKKIGIIDRKVVRIRNNEKGNCPFCNSPVTFKARGKMAARNIDIRWFVYVDPTKDGFIFRYFHAVRTIRSDAYVQALLNKQRVEEYINEYKRAVYTFPDGKPQCTDYEWTIYKSTGKTRWCYASGRINCTESVLYPENLPQAWEHTPMKYSALEVLSANIPTVPLQYEEGITAYLKYPKLEWLCKMGLNNIAKSLINGKYGSIGKVNLERETIYEILGLNKINTKILQEIDGNTYHLRLLQVSQQIGLQFKPEQLREYYETFECNTELLKQANRKVSLYKLVKYISKESEKYPLGEKSGCHRYAYNRYQERNDPRIERKRNMAHDWLEYLKWCKALKYDLDNMFIYMPKNFKKVHDRTAQEYQVLMDKRAADKKRREEQKAKEQMEQTKEALKEILKFDNGINAFKISGNKLMLVVPETAEDIKAEGISLHHCVGGYVERVAKGETNIFFIRKTEAPNISYYTMEWKDNKVVQCRGLHNCDMTQEVKGFVQLFEKKMLEIINKNKSKKHRKVG